MTYDVRHKLNLQGTFYLRGDTITSEDINSPRLEATLQRINWIKPRKEEPQAPAIPETEMPAPDSLPAKNKGGRPRKNTA